MTGKLVCKMIDFYQGSHHDVSHFLKVYAYAQTIGQMENLSNEKQLTLEAAAIVHDISCPLCREKYGSAAGHLQEQESETLLRPFLEDSGLSEPVKERVIALVCRHHTYTGIDRIDCQILLEADYLVNAGEGELSAEAIRAFREKVFKTSTGTKFLDSLYLKRTSPSE